MTIKTSRTSPLLTGNIKIRGHGPSEGGEPFVRLDVGRKRVLVPLNNLLLSPNVEFARLQNHGALLTAFGPRDSSTLSVRRNPVGEEKSKKIGRLRELGVWRDKKTPMEWPTPHVWHRVGLRRAVVPRYPPGACRGAAASNNMLLFFDEADSAEGSDPRATANAVLNAIKDISGGKGKGRGNDPDVSTSYTPILSTSNVSVPQMLAITKRRVDEFSYIDRLLDIPAPAGGHGFFENLHGFSDLAKFRDRLIELACLHYGLAGRAYVWHVAHALKNDREEFVAFVRGRREQYRQAVAHLTAPGRKLLRVHGKFAT